MISIQGQEFRLLGRYGGLFTLVGVASLLLLSGSAWGEKRPRGVPEEAVPFRGHWYAFYLEEIYTWPEAIRACQNRGGHLTCLETAEEREFVVAYVNSVTSQRFWVGGYPKGGQWLWITGPTIPAEKIIGKVPAGSARLCVATADKNRDFAPVPERPVSQLNTYVCEWTPGEKVALTLPESSISSSLSTSEPKVSPPAGVVGGSGQANQERVWTSAAGTSIKAKLVECDGKVARLQTGKQQVNLMVNQLGPDDQIFIKSWMQEKSATSPREESAPLKKWPATVEVTRTPEIKTVSEDEKAKKFVYQSPHYEFTAPIQLSKSVVQELAVLSEATYALLDELPVGLNLRVGETAPLKILLVEDVNEIIKLGGSGTNEHACLNGAVVVTLENLGAEKKNGRWTFTAHKATLWDARLRIAEQLYCSISGALPVWFDVGFRNYVSEMRYADGRFLVSGQRGAIRDFLKRENPVPTFLMPDLKSCMEMSVEQWNGLVHASKSTDYHSADVLLVYYFLHLDGQGDSDFAAKYVKAMAAKMPARMAQKQFLLRGRSYADLTSDVVAKFKDLGIRIEVQEPKD